MHLGTVQIESLLAFFNFEFIKSTPKRKWLPHFFTINLALSKYKQQKQ